MASIEGNRVAGRLENRGKVVLVWGWIAGLVLGCSASRGGWQPSDVADSAPTMRLIENSRIGDLAPHFRPLGDQILLFLCRWPTGSRIAVSLPPDANERELGILRRALRVWSEAGLGITLVESEARAAALEIRFADGEKGRGRPAGAGDTLADCRLDPRNSDELVKGQTSDAKLVWASVHLVRNQIDVLDRRIPLDDSELLGTALHELGHALGFSSHVARGNSIMVRTTEEVRRMGASVIRGRPLAAPNLRALYGLPEGLVVGRRVLESAESERMKAFLTEFEGKGLEGPYTRVGDRGARYFYRSENGSSAVLSVAPWPSQTSGSSDLEFRIRAPRGG